MKKNEKAQVCICIPVYNGEAFIAQTISCMLRQTYDAILIKVIDNCSTDRTCEIVEQFTDERVVLIRNEKNVGMTGNFNKCLEHAEGEYLQILCADDKVADTCIAEKVQAMEQHKDCTMVFSASEVRDETEKVIMRRNPFRSDRELDGLTMFKTAFRKYNLFGEPSNVMLRVSAIAQAGQFDERMYYAVDWEYWSRFCLTGNVYYVNKPLSYFYVRNTSETGMLLKKKQEIQADDRKMVELCRQNPQMQLTAADVLAHTINGKIRLMMKMVFAKLKK